MKWSHALLVAAVSLGVGSPAFAENRGTSKTKPRAASAAKNPKADEFYIGGGIGRHSLDPFDDATGYQIFGGYELPFNWAGARHTVEVGYMDTGDFDLPPVATGISASGLWSTYMLNWTVAEAASVFGRLGLDFGDDDGVMLGVGVEFELAEPWAFRFEVVQRQNIDSLELNVVYRF